MSKKTFLQTQWNELSPKSLIQKYRRQEIRKATFDEASACSKYDTTLQNLRFISRTIIIYLNPPNLIFPKNC